MKILVTGANGFIGKNLIARLKYQSDYEILQFTSESKLSDLDKYCAEIDFVYHLAGINRPQNTEDFMEGNYNFTAMLINMLKKHMNRCPIVFSSSIQAELDNPYGISKKASEELLFNYQKANNVGVYVYRLPNVFGKWCRPNYNSVIATFSHNIARGLPIHVEDKSKVLNLVYIDDVVDELINLLNKQASPTTEFFQVPISYEVSLEEIVQLLYSFKGSREEKTIPNMSNDFEKKLYSTYLSYLEVDQFKYALKMNIDERGSFTEFIRTPDRGQVSVNISKPGITKGNHWHDTKNEKFLVVSGQGVIRFRKIGSEEIIEYFVSEEKLEVVDIPIGYTHNIENLGTKEMVTIMWVNEPFNREKPDTHYLEV